MKGYRIQNQLGKWLGGYDEDKKDVIWVSDPKLAVPFPTVRLAEQALQMLPPGATINSDEQ